MPDPPKVSVRQPRPSIIPPIIRGGLRFFTGGPMLEVDMGEGSFFILSEFGLDRISIQPVLFSLGKGVGLVCLFRP